MNRKIDTNNITITAIGNASFDPDYMCDSYVEGAKFTDTKIALTDDELEDLTENHENWCDENVSEILMSGGL